MRRIVPVILVLTQLAQGMAVPHSHAGTGVAESAEHDQRPHFHLCGLPGHHDHHHHHGHGHCHHHDHGDYQEPIAPPANDAELPPANHDDDAVYQSDALVAAGALSVRWWLDTWHYLVLPPDGVSASISGLPAALPPRALSPPFAGQFSCPVFLQTLALLL